MEKPKNRPPTTPDYDEEVLHTMFTLSKWSGLDNYVCRCGAGFLDPKTAVDHWLSQHSGWTPPPATDIVDTGLVAPSGNPIYKEVETEPNDDKEDDE
jgi:hypothetical protein